MSLILPGFDDTQPRSQVLCRGESLIGKETKF